MNFRELARIGAEPSPTPLGAFVVEYLEVHGATRRVDLITAAENEWRIIAGRDMTVSLTSRMKKALRMLEEQGSIRKTGAYGRYELTDSIAITEGDLVEIDGADDEPVENDEQPGTPPETVRGQGDQYVYCYFLDAYRQRAKQVGSDRWPIKIGMTTGEVRHRIAQHATAMPESPTLAIVLRTANAALLERLLHLVLAYWDRRDDTSGGGSEWFITNPEEILAIYDWLSSQQFDEIDQSAAYPADASPLMDAGSRSP
jgi:hypothetical protein